VIPLGDQFTPGEGSSFSKLTPELFVSKFPQRIVALMPRMLRYRGTCGRITGLGLTVTSLDLRRFCTQHDIRRDIRVGRPRTRTYRAESDSTQLSPPASERDEPWQRVEANHAHYPILKLL
jgi:hypothetical protein